MAKVSKTTTSKPPRSKSSAKTSATGEKAEVEDAIVLDEPVGEPPKKMEGEPQDRSSQPGDKGDDGVNAEPGRAAGDPPQSNAMPENGPKHVATPEKPRRSPGFFSVLAGMIAGGAIAAIIGFAAARYVVPEGWPFPGVPPEEDPVAQAVNQQAEEIAAQQSVLAALQQSAATKSDVDALRAVLTEKIQSFSAQASALEARLSDLETRLSDLEQRLAAVEKSAPEGSAAAKLAAEAYAKELAGLREMFQGELEKIRAAQTDVSKMEADAAESAKTARLRAAAAQIGSAVASGKPFSEALAVLASASVSVPDALAAFADTGVPTLAALQAAFPDAARKALDAATRAAVADGSMSRLSGFLRSQLGTRSLEPHPGNDADAILSRAEAAVKSGNLAEAIAEIETLPTVAGQELSPWRALAQKRLEAVQASKTISDSLAGQ